MTHEQKERPGDRAPRMPTGALDHAALGQQARALRAQALADLIAGLARAPSFSVSQCRTGGFKQCRT